MKNAKNQDQKNLKNLKLDLSKGKKELINKESISSYNRGIYKKEIMQDMNSDEKSKFRSKIRRDLKKYMHIILGKDRKDLERIEGIFDFLSFYKRYWIIQDFKIENFSNSSNKIDRKDYIDLLDYIKSLMESNKIKSIDSMQEIIKNQIKELES